MHYFIHSAEVNYFAVLVCTVIAIFIGSMWYSPLLFGKYWMRKMGFTKDDLEAKGSDYILSMAASFITMFILVQFILALGTDSFHKGAMIGFFMWLGFVATSTISQVVWEGKKMSIYFLYNAMQLLTLVLTGGILAVWK